MKTYTREELLDGIQTLVAVIGANVARRGSTITDDWVERCVLEVSGETLAQWRHKWGEGKDED